MRQREKIIIHDKPMAFTLIGLFFLSFIVVLNVLHIRDKQLDADRQQEKEQYATRIVYLYNGEETAKLPDFEHLNLTKGNVLFVFNTVVGNGYAIAPIHMVAVFNEPLPEELKEGRFPTDNEIAHGRKCVVIGEGLTRLTEKKKEGTVLKIDGVDYDVTGILKDVAGDGTDNRVFVFQSCLAATSANDLDGTSSYFVKYGSNEETQLQTEQLLVWLHGFIPDSAMEKSEEKEMEMMDGMKTTAQLLHQYTEFALYGLFIFCMIGCLIVSTIWMKRRKKEMMIRKAFGCKMTGIIAVLLKDLGIMLGIALAGSLAFFLLQGIVTGENWFREEYLFRNLCYLLGAVMLMMVCSFIHPIYMAYKISPVEGTRE